MDAKLDSDSILRFGVFELDLRAGELRKNGNQIKLQDSPFRALRLLALHPQQVLSRQELRKALWGDDVFVDFDRAINTTINRLRETLGDLSSNPVFIETIARSGYRWIAPVQVVSRGDEAVAEVEALPSQATGNETGPTRLVGRSSRRSIGWAVAMLAVACVVALLGLGWQRSHGFPTILLRKALAGGGANPTGGLKRTRDPEAEELYLKGRYYWNRRTPADLNKAVDYFTQAIVHDPSYAQPYVGLADCYNLLREFAAMPSEEAFPRALAAAKKAAELDDTSAEAHASLAFVTFYGSWDAAGAETEFRRALQLDPHYVAGHHWYATFLMANGRFPEAMQEFETAQKLDPSSTPILADKALLLFNEGRLDEAEVLLKQIEASQPKFFSTHAYLSHVYLVKRDYRHYLSEAREAALLSQDDSELAILRAAELGFRSNGERGLLENTLEIKKKLCAAGNLSPVSVADTAALLGRNDEALRYLREAYQRHDTYFLWARVDTSLARLRDDPDFRKLLAEAGLAPRA